MVNQMAARTAFDRIFDTLPDLLESTQTHNRGDTLFVLQGGYSYEVADPRATDAHLKTAGGVILYVVPAPVLWLDAFAPHGDGIGDDTANIKAWLALGEELSATCRVARPGPYLTRDLDLNRDGLPPVLDWNGCALKAAPGTGTLLTLSNPHSRWDRWQMGAVYIDCANAADTGFHLNGAQNLIFPPVHVENANSHPIVIEGSKNAGVYGCTFTKLCAIRNAGQVRLISNPEHGYRNNANTFNVTAKSSSTDGLYLNHLQGELNVWLERNDGYGAMINNTMGVNISGYVEDNGGNPDRAFFLTRNARGVQLHLHRMLGNVDPASPGIHNPGNVFSSSNNQDTLGRYFSGATRFDSVAADAVTGYREPQGESSALVPNGKTLTIATRDELGDNRIFCAYLFVPGTGRYARADVVVFGTADTVAPDCVRVENMVSDTLSRDVTWATDGRSLQISNTSGEERDVRWSLVAVAS